MLSAPSLDDILQRAGDSASLEDPTSQRLVSIVFANPDSTVWRELRDNRAFLDDRSGNKWDLFFAGLSVYGAMPNEKHPLALPDIEGSEIHRYFNMQIFRELESEIVRAQRDAQARKASKVLPWRFSGGTDLVNFMAYAGEPDWLTLRSLNLDASLSKLTEQLSHWETENIDEFLASDEFLNTQGPLTISTALRWSAKLMVGAILSDLAGELLRLPH